MDEELRRELRKVFKSGHFLDRRKAALRALNPIDAPPSWIDEELRDALDAIGGPHERKKRTTVLRLAEAKASGISVGEVFASDDCCSAPIWYGRRSPYVKQGWMEYPDIKLAMEMAEKKAHHFYDALEEQRITMRRHVLEDTEDRLSEIARAAAEVLLDIMLDENTAGDVRRKAAVDALTHAAPETAPKSRTEQSMDLRVSSSGPTMRDIRNRSRRLPERVVGDEAEDIVVEDVTEKVAVLEAEVTDGHEEDEDGPPPPPPGGLKIPPSGLYEEPPAISGNGHSDDEAGE